MKKIIAALALLSLSFLTKAELSKSDNLIKAINNLDVTEVITIIQADSGIKNNKHELVKLALEQVKKQELATRLIFRSSGDLFNFVKSAALAYAGFSLLRAGYIGLDLTSDRNFTIDASSWGYPAAMDYQKALKPLLTKTVPTAAKMFATNKKLFEEKITSMGRSIPVISTGLILAGSGLIFAATSKALDALQAKNAQEKLKKAQAILGYIQNT